MRSSVSVSFFDVNELEESLMSQIIKLHHKFFMLTNTEVRKYLEKRDCVYIFREKKSDDVIGTVAVKWIENEGDVIIYIGNVVVEKNYQGHNFLTHILFQTYLKTLWRFPGRNIYFSGFISSPKAYNISRRFPYHFPRADIKTPESIMRAMKKTVNEIVGFSKADIQSDYIIVCNFKKEKLMIKNSSAGKSMSSHDGYFEEINPDFKSGKQLLMLFPMSAKTFFIAFKNSLFYILRVKFNLFSS